MTQACFLREKQEKVLNEWISISKKRFPAASDKSRTAIRDHVPEMMNLLCEVIETKRFDTPNEASKTHGRQRHSFGDYTLIQVIGEYSILKNLVFDELTAGHADTVEIIRLVDLFFDSAITIAANEFAKLREDELVASAARLKDSNMDLERFAGVAAHDLRSPAGTIVGYSDLLIDSCLNDPPKLKSATTIQRTAKRMIDLIDQLLVYAKLGKSEHKFVRVDVATCVDDAVSSLDGVIEIASAKIQVGELPQISGDPVLITQLFQNLIANSLKFCSPERTCEIKISGQVADHKVKIEVADNGLGFDPTLSKALFEPFIRAHEHLPIQGSGIGLATVERIVKLHGGTVTASGETNRGATFTMEFPEPSKTQ